MKQTGAAKSGRSFFAGKGIDGRRSCTGGHSLPRRRMPVSRMLEQGRYSLGSAGKREAAQAYERGGRPAAPYRICEREGVVSLRSQRRRGV